MPDKVFPYKTDDSSGFITTASVTISMVGIMKIKFMEIQ